MSNPNKLDLPTGIESIFPKLIDENFSTYQLQKEGNAQVFVQKYVIKKDSYIPYFPTPIGSFSEVHTQALLIKEDSFTDIGGGYATFLRHYARIPDSWFDYEPKSVLYYFRNNVGGAVGINYDYGCGQLPVGFNGCGVIGFSRRNVTVLAKATRYYITQDVLESYVNNDFILPQSGGGWKYSHLYPDAQAENTYTTINQFGKNYSVPSYLFVNQPRVKTVPTDSNEIALEIDDIKKWQGNIYEITRYTSQIQPNFSPEVDELTFQMEYRFESDVTQDKRFATTVFMSSLTTSETVSDPPSGEFQNLIDVSNPEDGLTETFFISVGGGLIVKSVTTSGGTSTLDVSEFSGFSVGSISSTWNNSNALVQMTVFIGNE